MDNDNDNMNLEVTRRRPNFAHRCPVCAPMQKAKTLLDALVTVRGPMMGRGSDRHYTQTRTWPCGHVESGDLYPYLLADIFGGAS